MTQRCYNKIDEKKICELPCLIVSGSFHSQIFLSISAVHLWLACQLIDHKEICQQEQQLLYATFVIQVITCNYITDASSVSHRDILNYVLGLLELWSTWQWHSPITQQIQSVSSLQLTFLHKVHYIFYFTNLHHFHTSSASTDNPAPNLFILIGTLCGSSLSCCAQINPIPAEKINTFKFDAIIMALKTRDTQNVSFKKLCSRFEMYPDFLIEFLIPGI